MLRVGHMSAFGTAFSRLWPARRILAVYLSLRALTCVLPFLHLFSPGSSSEDARYGLEFGVLVLMLTLLASLPYGMVLGSFMSGEHESVRSRRTILIVISVGALDLASGLAIVALTDGWSSQFRHYWSMALTFPCLVLGLKRSLILAVLCIVMTNLVLSIAGSNWTGSMNDGLYLQIGWAVATLAIAGMIGFLGDLVFELQRSRHKAEIARDNLETILEITRQTASDSEGINDLMRRIARAIGERHRYELVGIYIVESGGDRLRLVGWLGEFEFLRRHERRDDSLVHEAISAMDARLARDGQSWNAAIPFQDADLPMGVLFIRSEGIETDTGRMMSLGHLLVGQIVVGIQVAGLRQRLESAADQREWERITRQIHDRISSSLYSLMLYLETYVEQDRREGNPVHRRLENLIPPFSQLLIDTRIYMYHLLSALRGERTLDQVVDSLAAEFQNASGIPVRLSIGGSTAHVPITTTISLYHILQHRLSDILLDSNATMVEIDLTTGVDYISLGISDDGNENSLQQMDRIRELARGEGGDLEILSTDGGPTRIKVDMSVARGRTSLDQTGDN